MHRVALVVLTLVPLTLAPSRPGATQTPVDRIGPARAQIRAHNLDSAAALLHQVADSPSGASVTERAAAFLWLGIVSFYQGDDSGTTRSFRTALALDPTIDAGSLGAIDSTLAAAWQHEQASAPRPRAPSPAAAPAAPAVHDCARGCKHGERPPRLLALPQMRVDNLGQLGPSGVHGRVVVRAVIDESGRLEPETISMVMSTASGFERAVREVLPMLRFRPAMDGAGAISALVELRFDIQPEGLDWVRYSVDTP